MKTMKSLQPKKPTTLKTPQSLIHVNHNMTILQYKYWVIFLHHLKEQIRKGIEPEKNGYSYISLDELSVFLGYTPKKSEIYGDLKKLRSYSVEYNVLEKDGERAKVIDGFLYSASVSSNRIGFILPPVFIQAMLELDTEAKSIFHLLNWDVFNSFNGKYEAILYKLCKDYAGIKKTPKFTVAEFREYMGLKENEYNQFFELNRWTIQKPIKSINESDISDIKISVEFEKQGRKVIGLQFFVGNKQTALPFVEFMPHTAFDKAKMPIPPENQNQYLEKFSPEQVEAIIERANEYSDHLKQQGKKTNIGAIYKTAFAEGWGLDNLEAKKLEKAKEEDHRRREKEKREAEARLEAEKAEKDRLAKDEAQKAHNIFEALPLEEQERILDDVQKSLASSVLVDIFKKDRKENKAHKNVMFAGKFKNIIFNELE